MRGQPPPPSYSTVVQSNPCLNTSHLEKVSKKIDAMERLFLPFLRFQAGVILFNLVGITFTFMLVVLLLGATLGFESLLNKKECLQDDSA